MARAGEALVGSPPNEQSQQQTMYDGYTKYDQAVAQDYEKARQNEAHWWAEDRFIADYFQRKSAESLLDLPVGTGRFFRHYIGVQSLTGVDISETMLAEAKQKLPLLPKDIPVRLEQGDVLGLRFGEAEFEVAVVWRLLHLLPAETLRQAIGELCRVTRGELVVQTYAGWGRWRRRWRRWVSRWERLRARPTPAEGGVSPAQATPKPWSHIQSFNHPQAQVDALFQERGFVPSLAKFLAVYEQCDVRVTVYARAR